MKQFKKIVTCFLYLSFIITAAFFFAVLIVSFNRHHDGIFNTPQFKNLVSYQEAGGTTLDYYLGYTLMDGYDTQTEPDEDGMCSPTSSEILGKLYSLFIAIGIIVLSFITWTKVTRKTNLKDNLIGYLLSIILILISIQFISYFTREGINFFWQNNKKLSNKGEKYASLLYFVI